MESLSPIVDREDSFIFIFVISTNQIPHVENEHESSIGAASAENNIYDLFDQAKEKTRICFQVLLSRFAPGEKKFASFFCEIE